MAANKRLEYGSPLQLSVMALGSYTYLTYPILTGNPVVLVGSGSQSYAGLPIGLAMVANETPVSPTGAFDGFGSFDLDGSFELTVLAETGESPAVNSKVVPGDVVFANINTGTKTLSIDGNTTLFTGFTLDKNPSGIPFGTVVQGSVAAGQSGLVWVRLKVSPIS